MNTRYKEMASNVLEAIENDPQTGNFNPREYSMLALVAMVTDDLPVVDAGIDDFPESGYDHEVEVKTITKEYLEIRKNREDPCLTVDDYVLLVDYVQKTIWADIN